MQLLFKHQKVKGPHLVRFLEKKFEALQPPKGLIKKVVDYTLQKHINYKKKLPILLEHMQNNTKK